MADDLSRGAGITRRYALNMPQMSLHGLSETWLFKELGDLHWSMITDGLKVRTSEILDESGARLYATFCRVRFESTAPLSRFSENEEIAIEGGMSRYGPGVFFSDIAIKGDGKSIRARVMSSFSKRGVATSNVDLVKAGLPVIPDACPIAKLDALPAFGSEYNAQRNQAPARPIYECDYAINPYQDINGVGLLYFAAYQSITDTCELSFAGKGAAWAEETSTSKRDIFYFANCDIDEKLIYRVHGRRDSDSGVDIESSLSRSSDGVLMAYVVTRKEFIGGRAAAR